MQKLEKRNTYTSTDTFLVRGSCDLALNREETLSVQGLKTSSNNLEETQSQQTGRLNVVVFVIAKEGFPLMPCTPAKAKKLLKINKAKVVKRCPFTIQLNWTCENQVQEVTCGIDAGSDNIGYSCITEKKVLIKGEAKLDSHMKDRLNERKMYRRNRRSKLWYRKKRTHRNIPEGWLPPSILRKFNVHKSLIERLEKILPITKVIVETASFDTQKLDNPEIQGTEYQQGNLYGYKNMKNYIFARENGKCQLCGEKDGKFHLHHIIPRSKGGTNRSANLALLHEKCHNKLHKNKLENTLNKNEQFKEATFMGIIHKRFQDLGYETTYGYITAVNRNALGLEKTHANDAFVIAGGTTQPFIKQHKIIQKRKNNRGLQLNRKGFKPSIRKNHYMNQPYDLVTFERKVWKVKGIHNYGKSIIIANDLGEKKDVNIKKIVPLFHSNSLIWNI